MLSATPQLRGTRSRLADLAACLHAAGRDDRLGVLPRRDAAGRDRVSEGDGGLAAAAPTPYTVRWYLTPELWLALAAGVDRIDAVGAGAGARGWRALEPTACSTGRCRCSSTAALMALLVASIMSMAARTYNPFIYFRF